MSSVIAKTFYSENVTNSGFNGFERKTAHRNGKPETIMKEDICRNKRLTFFPKVLFFSFEHFKRFLALMFLM